MALFTEDVSIYGIDSENRVLRRAEGIANKAYSEDYYTYQVLSDIANLIDTRYEKQRGFEDRVENMEMLYESTKRLLHMDKDELIYDCKDMGIKTTGSKRQLKDRLAREFEHKYGY